MGALAQRAVAALLAEVELTPKPGLVDAANSGAHQDMDISTFRHSAAALAGYFAEAERIGADLPLLRQAGIQAEHAMYAATGGVNTHKGAIFSLGLLVATGGDRAAAAELAAQTLGEQTRVAGVGGARAEAAAGFPHAVVGLREFQRSGSWHRGLVAIMAQNEDSNLVARGGEAALREVQAWASDLVATELAEADFVEQLRLADAQFTAKNWSPGGSADLLAVAIFLSAGKP